VAIKEFTTAIENDPTDHVFFSNRSASYASLKQYEEALKDAEKCVELKGDWAKVKRRSTPLHSRHIVCACRSAAPLIVPAMTLLVLCALCSVLCALRRVTLARAPLCTVSANSTRPKPRMRRVRYDDTATTGPVSHFLHSTR
jgi:hypothetical protein